MGFGVTVRQGMEYERRGITVGSVSVVLSMPGLVPDVLVTIYQDWKLVE